MFFYFFERYTYINMQYYQPEIALSHFFLKKLKPNNLKSSFLMIILAILSA